MMTGTKVITRTKPVWLLGVIAVALGTLGGINLFSSLTPYADLDVATEAAFDASRSMVGEARVAEQTRLIGEHERLVQHMPSEPFAWMRLAYLRLVILHDPKKAFEALRMSDFVSPNEPRQKLERALMWYNLRDVENAEQQMYQDTLWQKAVTMPNDGTWVLQKQAGLVAKAEAILQTENPELYKQLHSHP